MVRLLFLYVFVFAFCGLNAQKITWSSNQLLEWSDFQGPKDPMSPLLAATNCGIDYSFSYDENGLHTTVTCYFDRQQSWKTDGGETDRLLNHEQRHFDICEIYARKLRAAFAKYTPKPETLQADLKKIYDKTWKSYRSKQAEYDEQTDHSKIREKQNEWDEKIDSGLKKLEEFAVSATE